MTPTQETIPLTAAAAKKYGHLAAAVLCLVRYRCHLTGADRLESEDGRMWRASYVKIGEDVGASSAAVGRAVKKLEAEGALVVERHPAHYGDQTLSYRVVPDADVWWDDSDTLTSQDTKSSDGPDVLTSQDTKSSDGIRRNRHLASVDSAISSITQEGERRVEEVRVPAAPPAPSFVASEKTPVVQSPLLAPVPDPEEVSPFCSKHPEGTSSPCGACGKARKRFEAAESAQKLEAEQQEAVKLFAKHVAFVNLMIAGDPIDGTETEYVREWVESKSLPRHEWPTTIDDLRAGKTTIEEIRSRKRPAAA